MTTREKAKKYLAELRAGKTLQLGAAKVWVRSHRIQVQVFEGVEPDFYPCNLAGVLRLLELTGNR